MALLLLTGARPDSSVSPVAPGNRGMDIPSVLLFHPQQHILRYLLIVVPAFGGLRVSRFFQGSGTKLADIPIGEWVAQKVYHGFFRGLLWFDGVWSRLLYIVRCLFNNRICLFPLL